MLLRLWYKVFVMLCTKCVFAKGELCQKDIVFLNFYFFKKNNKRLYNRNNMFFFTLQEFSLAPTYTYFIRNKKITMKNLNLCSSKKLFGKFLISFLGTICISIYNEKSRIT